MQQYHCQSQVPTHVKLAPHKKSDTKLCFLSVQLDEREYCNATKSFDYDKKVGASQHPPSVLEIMKNLILDCINGTNQNKNNVCTNSA